MDSEALAFSACPSTSPSTRSSFSNAKPLVIITQWLTLLLVLVLACARMFELDHVCVKTSDVFCASTAAGRLVLVCTSRPGTLASRHDSPAAAAAAAAAAGKRMCVVFVHVYVLVRIPAVAAAAGVLPRGKANVQWDDDARQIFMRRSRPAALKRKEPAGEGTLVSIVFRVCRHCLLDPCDKWSRNYTDAVNSNRGDTNPPSLPPQS